MGIAVKEYETSEYVNKGRRTWSYTLTFKNKEFTINYYNKEYKVILSKEIKPGRIREDYKITINGKDIEISQGKEIPTSEKDLKKYVRTYKKILKDEKKEAIKREKWLKEQRLQAKKRKNELHIKTLFLNKMLQKQIEQGLKVKNLVNEQNFKEEIYKLILETPIKENFKWSKSPYGDSFYYHHEDDVIDWGCKPIGSYRISDHWNWHSYGDVHCEIVEDEYLESLELRIMTKDGYAKIN